MRPSQRLLAQGVLALGARLLRMAPGARFSRVSAEMARLMGRRRAMLRELRLGIRDAAELSCVEAVSGAVAEADRGLLVMMNLAASRRH